MSERRIHSWYARWQHVLYLLILCFSAVLPYFALRLRNDNAIENWLGGDSPAVADYGAFGKQFGSSDFVLMAFDRCTPDDVRLENLAQQVEQFPVVASCWTPERAAEMQGLLSGGDPDNLTDLRFPIVGRHPRFAAAFIAIRASPNLDRAHLLKQLAQAAQQAGFEEDQIHWGGPPVVNVSLDRLATASLSVLFPLACVVMFLLLWYLLGRLSLALMVLFCSGLSVLATLSGMAYFGATMNMLLVALPPMILVLNLSFGVHLIHQWQRASGREHPVGFAVGRTIKPASLAALTTAIGTASLVTSRFAPVRSFGLWAAVGTVLALVITYVYLPAMLVGERTGTQRPKRWFGPFPMPNARVAIAVWIAALLVSLGGLTRLRTESDALKFLPEGSRTLSDYRRIEQRLTGLLSVEAVVDLPSSLSWPQRVWIVRQIESRIRNHPAVENTIGLVDLLRADPIRAGEQASALVEDEEYALLAQSMMSSDGRFWRLTASIASVESPNLSTIIGELERSIPDDIHVRFTGLVPLIIAAQEEIFRSLLISFAVAVLLLIPVLSLAFRSFDAAIVALMPNVAPVAIVFGLYGWLRSPLNVGTLMTASIALGIALDDTLHLLAHFRYGSQSDPSATNAQLAQKSVQACGAAMAKTTIIAVLGLGLLVFSSFGPSSQFGALLALLLGVALICDLLLMPALLSTALGNCFRAGPSPGGEHIGPRPFVEDSPVDGLDGLHDHSRTRSVDAVPLGAAARSRSKSPR